MEGGMRKKIEGGKMGLRPLEERFRLRSSSYDPTSRFRLEVRGWRQKRDNFLFSSIN
jgi:hypothetical protein